MVQLSLLPDLCFRHYRSHGYLYRSAPGVVSLVKFRGTRVRHGFHKGALGTFCAVLNNCELLRVVLLGLELYCS